ncbi:MAG: IS91 family transposase [Gemmatimonadetes bacterium]|nr:IS91 family transposase [Gemmatimonadota bacterium]
MGPARDPRRIELADIVRAHGAAVQQAQRLTRGQHRALRAIATCRTSALGGHTEGCDVCGAVRIAYNSCRNRHCPKCQTLAKERWLAARRAELLPVEYFHVVFTLPHPLNPLAQGNPRVIYSLLFRAAADTLAAFGQDPKYLGGELGLIAILHTWGQALVQHLHLHCVVPGGALARDGARWLSAKRGFLFPVRALAAVFRGKYLDLLRRTFDRQEITFAGRAAGLADPKAFGEFLAALRQHAWVVYAKPPFAGPAQVLEYLGRYTHRVAISNDRLVSLEEGVVRFRWKDYAHGNTVKTMALPSEAFLHRFLLHVVPDGFVRIRHFGLLANRGRAAKLARCRALLALPPAVPPAAPESAAALILRVSGVDLTRCPACAQGRLHLVARFRPGEHPVPPLDSS